MTTHPAARAALLLALLVLSLPACGTLRTSPARFDAARVVGWQVFAHDDLAEVLAAHVDAQGRVEYAALREDRAALDRYVATLAEVGPRTHPALFPDADHRLAYHLNAYNALVLFNVLEHPGLTSVNAELLDFFYLSTFRLDGREIDLYDLENVVVRGYGEPRIHFALNRGCVGCARLPTEPFDGARLQEQLARETARFLAQPRNVKVVDGRLQLSALFDWYAEDFPPAPAAWVLQHREGELPVFDGVDFRDFDWTLNARSR